MSLVSILGKQMLADLLSSNSRERRFDIEKLESIARRAGNASFARLLHNLGVDMDRGAGLARAVPRIGAAITPACRRKAVENLAWGWAVEGARIQGMDGSDEHAVPGAATLVPTLRCNLSCPGCRSAESRERDDLRAEAVTRTLEKARGEGRYLVVVSGGEPFLRPDVVLEAARRFGDMYFLVFTNGTVMNAALARSLAEAGNVAVALTVVGSRETTDRHRGTGSFRRASAAMHLLRREGVPFGFAPRIGAADPDLLSDGFVRRMLRSGALFMLCPSGVGGDARRFPLLVVHFAAASGMPERCDHETPAPLSEVRADTSARRAYVAAPRDVQGVAEPMRPMV
jgi:uncharacterized Fe-S cluster-containing radical SAM superfamily protein